MFTEHDTEKYYDHQDDLYRSVWDPEGALHYGYFPDLGAAPAGGPAEQLVAAFRDWDEELLARSGIDEGSAVLDVGCGNGTTSVWLARRTGCRVTGVDLSLVRVTNAERLRAAHPEARVAFHKASALHLPFPDASFSHVWSQSTLYHVHDRPRALAQVHRVLRNRGAFVFDDLVTPRTPVSPAARRHVYDRLLCEPSFSAHGYVEHLSAAGFEVVEARDLSAHLRRTYELLVSRVAALAPELTVPYQAMIDAVDAGDVGWSCFTCRKAA
ncbi:methyltransferase domain-containing protein [Streptomyces sp. NPDC048057]|uniref:class I SAM-dependent methyltransferase n=1 Tax=Streptomyces sp. NPDC048057 TaxID=3155628 RepID=UPI0033CC6E62